MKEKLINIYPIKNYKNKLNNTTLKNIGYLTLANILAQIFSLIGAFYIPRLLGAEQYGIYNTITAYIILFSVFTFSGLNKVIIREAARNPEKTKEILESTIGFQNLFSIIAFLIAILILLFVDYENGVKIFIVIYSISLLLYGTQNSLNSVYQAYENMKFLAFYTIISQVTQVVLSILLLKWGFGVLSLLLLQLLIQILLLLINYHYSKKFVIFNIFSKIIYKAKYIKSGLNFTLMDITGALSERIDIVMLSFLTIPSNVGIYALAYNIANKGLLIRGPISQSLFPYYSRSKLVNKDLFYQTLIITIPSMFIAILVCLISRPVIITLIGKEYAESAVILNILIFFLIMNYASIPYGLALQVSNNEKKLLNLNIIRALLNISGNLILYHYFGLKGIAYSTLISISFVTTVQIIIGRKMLRKSNSKNEL